MPDPSRQTCFVISPIGPEGSAERMHADEVFEYFIRPAMEQCQLTPLRSDHLDSPGKITEQVFGHLLKDDLCIAILSGYNPNVFYELAIAHSARRPVILMMEKGNSLPFDLKDHRCVLYDFRPSHTQLGTYVRALVEQVQEIKRSGWNVPAVTSQFRQFASAHEGNLVGSHDIELCRIIGLLDVPAVAADQFQTFELTGSNRNAVANLWADPQEGNHIRANLARRDGEHVLRVTFASTSVGFTPAVAVNPQGRIAQKVVEGRTTLRFKAAVAPGTMVNRKSSEIQAPLVLGVRVVNGHAEHWEYFNATSRGLEQIRLSRDFKWYDIDLANGSLWREFGVAGKRPRGTRAEFQVVSSIVFQFGFESKTAEFGFGQGAVDIGEIGFTSPERRP